MSARALVVARSDMFDITMSLSVDFGGHDKQQLRHFMHLSIATTKRKEQMMYGQLSWQLYGRPLEVDRTAAATPAAV